MALIDSYGSFCSKLNQKFLVMSKNLFNSLILITISLLSSLDLIMVLSFLSLSFMLLKALYIKSLVLKLPNKMVELREGTSISLMLLEPYCFNLNFLTCIGLMSCCMLLSSSIESPLLFSKISLLIKCCMIIYLMSILSKCLATYVMLSPFLLIGQNCTLEQENMFSWDTSQVPKVMFFFILILEKFFFL